MSRRREGMQPNSAAAGDGGELARASGRTSFGVKYRFAAASEPQRWADMSVLLSAARIENEQANEIL